MAIETRARSDVQCRKHEMSSSKSWKVPSENWARRTRKMTSTSGARNDKGQRVPRKDGSARQVVERALQRRLEAIRQARRMMLQDETDAVQRLRSTEMCRDESVRPDRTTEGARYWEVRTSSGSPPRIGSLYLTNMVPRMPSITSTSCAIWLRTRAHGRAGSASPSGTDVTTTGVRYPPIATSICTGRSSGGQEEYRGVQSLVVGSYHRGQQAAPAPDRHRAGGRPRCDSRTQGGRCPRRVPAAARGGLTRAALLAGLAPSRTYVPNLLDPMTEAGACARVSVIGHGCGCRGCEPRDSPGR